MQRRGDASSYEVCAILTSPEQENNSNGPEKINDWNRAANLCWMRSVLLTTADVIELQATDAYSSLELTA
jgi:hypothetical protein